MLLKLVRATGESRTACTAPWTCSSGRTTAVYARAMVPPAENVHHGGTMVRTVQQNMSAGVSIGLLQDKIGHHPWIMAAAMH